MKLPEHKHFNLKRVLTRREVDALTQEVQDQKWEFLKNEEKRLKEQKQKHE